MCKGRGGYVPCLCLNVYITSYTQFEQNKRGFNLAIYLFRDTLKKLIESKNLEYQELIAS